ncbi:DPP IV N-terminal domain-containing protein [Flavobacterium sp.]|uniref:TolB family protein n=1 Tax=Flavobacterium sp. TaxID=239 RepID=UPI0028BD7C4B|nr:DPP IV N-terminal domain-containing protein [Flavobacterium sp.]
MINTIVILSSTLGFTQQQSLGKIGFVSTRDGNYEVYTMNSDGSSQTNISNNPKTDYGFSWSFDCKKVLFYSNRDGNDEIYVMNSNGSEVMNLTNNSSNDRIPVYSADNSKIAFVSDRSHKKGDIFIMDADGKNIIQITKNEYFEESPSFSNNSKKLLFTRELKDLTNPKASGNGEIFSIDLRTKKEAQLTNKEGYDSGAVFSPNGKKIAFYGYDKAKKFYDIYLMNPDGSNLEKLTDDATEDYSPTWSPDGNWLAFTRGDASNYDIWLININTKELKRLTDNPKRDESPFWCPMK